MVRSCTLGSPRAGLGPDNISLTSVTTTRWTPTNPLRVYERIFNTFKRVRTYARAIEVGFSGGKVPKEVLDVRIHLPANLDPCLKHLTLQPDGHWSTLVIARQRDIPGKIDLCINDECIKIKSKHCAIGQLILVQMAESSNQFIVPHFARPSTQDSSFLWWTIEDCSDLHGMNPGHGSLPR